MSQSGGVESRPIHLLVEASEILRVLTPSAFAALRFIYDDNAYTQSEIADEIGCSRSSVSTYLRDVADLPLPLATKRGYGYQATDAGEDVIGLFGGMLKRLGVSLHDIDWNNESDKNQVADLLTPLYNSRSAIPFFILYSIGDLGAVSTRIGLHSKPESVWLDDVIADVNEYETETVTRKQIKQTLGRFENSGIINFDGQQIALTDKGREHARLFDQVIQMLEQQEDEDFNSSSTKPRPESANPDTDDAQMDLSLSESGNVTLDGVPSQLALEETPKSQLSADNLGASHELPTIVPAYCLLYNEDTDEEGDQQPQPSPVFPLYPLTVGELADRVGQLLQDYDQETQLVPYWTVQTESGLSPVYPSVPQKSRKVDLPDEQ